MRDSMKLTNGFMLYPSNKQQMRLLESTRENREIRHNTIITDNLPNPLLAASGEMQLQPLKNRDLHDGIVAKGQDTIRTSYSDIKGLLSDLDDKSLGKQRVRFAD
jgi:hypothetical protein